MVGFELPQLNMPSYVVSPWVAYPLGGIDEVDMGRQAQERRVCGRTLFIMYNE